MDEVGRGLAHISGAGDELAFYFAFELRRNWSGEADGISRYLVGIGTHRTGKEQGLAVVIASADEGHGVGAGGADGPSA